MKKIKKALFCFMSLMVLLQYMMPTVVFAVENQGDFQLTSLSVDKEEKDTIEAKISLSFKAQTEESQTLIFNEDATVKDVKIENETESTKVDYVINKNKIEMKIAPRTEGTIILSVLLDSSDLKDDNLMLTNGVQTLKAPLKMHESESEEDATKETEESEKESESADKAKEVKIKRDGGKQNIRDLLTKVGISPATIIDDVKVVYINSNGHICTDLDSIPANASVEVNYSWSLPEELFGVIKEDDYFEFSLPDAIRVFPGTGPLIGNLGQYGSYEVFTDGRVRFEFNKNVETDHDIMGSFSYSTKFKRTEPGVVVIQTPNEDNAGPSKIRIRPNYDQAIDKSGHVNKVPNPTGIVWEVNINRPLSNMKDAELVDIVPAGTSLKSIEIYPETVDGTGAIVNIDRDHPLT